MITSAKFWRGRDVEFKEELSAEIIANALETTQLVNELLTRAALTKLDASSGWRPQGVNAAVGGAKKSNHHSAKAVDVADPQRQLQKWCLANLDILEELGLWMEHPRDTPSWCHLQTVPPRSGKRVFYAK